VANLDEMTTILSIASFISYHTVSASVVIACAQQEMTMTTISGVIASHSSFEWIMSTARYLLLIISWQVCLEIITLQPRECHSHINIQYTWQDEDEEKRRVFIITKLPPSLRLSFS